MTPEQSAAFIYAQATSAFIEALAMITANAERQMKGETLAYPEEAIKELIAKYGLGHNAVILSLGY